jgi:H+-translocating NAD(P) transhydrogenase subunit alpha
MMTTAAGTLTPAKVLVLGVGVAGLQAIATAKRLGASVEAYDVRPEVREQVQSVGGKFVDLGLDTTGMSGQGGYAKEQSAEFILRQQEALAQFVRAADIVITTAQIPGRKAPVLVTAAMQMGMKPGSIIVDLAAETGCNCELSKAGETALVDGVTMIAPINLASSMAFHASQLYAKNVVNLLVYMTSKDGTFSPKDDDDIVRETRVAHAGAVVHARVLAALAPKA